MTAIDDTPPQAVLFMCRLYANQPYPHTFDAGVTREQVLADGWKIAGLNFYYRLVSDKTPFISIFSVLIERDGRYYMPAYEIVLYEFFYRPQGEGYEIRALEGEPKLVEGDPIPPPRKSLWQRLRGILRGMQP